MYVDFENGKEQLAIRTEQAIAKKTKKEILGGEFDYRVQKLFRKYKRLGGEIVIERFNSYTTTTNDLQKYVDEDYRETGKRFQILIFDYIGLMACLSGKKDDNERISDAYLDVKNFLIHNDYESGWTAHHVTREAAKAREKSCYLSTDTAKCIDIVRHVDGMFGINQNDEEEAGGVARLEVVEQRDGLRHARMYFWMDIPTQTVKEFTKQEVKNYKDELGDIDKEDKEVRKKNNDI